eukprot:6485196-Amphidinium_carterae.1
MEVDDGTCGGPSARVPKDQEEAEIPSESKATGAQGGPSAGAPAQITAMSSVAEAPSNLKKNEDYVRKITQETFKFIQKQEEVLSEWKGALMSLDEDSEAHKSLLDQIAVVKRMVDYYKSAIQAAHAYAPAPSAPSGSITLKF